MSKQPAPSRALTVNEVAHRLGVTPATVRKHIASGALHATNLGGNASARRLRVSEDDLAAFVGGRPARSAAPTRVLTVADVSARLNIGRASVYRLIANGALRVVNVGVTGTRMRVREDDLSAFIEARTVEAADLPDTDDLLAAGS